MRLSIFVVLAVLFISCKSNTGVETGTDTAEIGYPIIMENFRINSPTDADWIGRPAKQKTTLQNDSTFSDTLYLTRPDGTSLRVWNVPVDSTSKWRGTMLAFIDSSLTTDLPRYDPTIHDVRNDYVNQPPEFYAFLMYESTHTIKTWDINAGKTKCDASPYICVPDEDVDEGIFRAEFRSYYNCGSQEYNSEVTIWLYYVYDHYWIPPHPLHEYHTGLHTKYVIDVSGLHQTIEHIQCGTPI